MMLAEDEKRMLAGENGPSLQRAMELPVRIAEANGAERMIDVSCTHMAA